jgi:hypothetical protein
MQQTPSRSTPKAAAPKNLRTEHEAHLVVHDHHFRVHVHHEAAGELRELRAAAPRRLPLGRRLVGALRLPVPGREELQVVRRVRGDACCIQQACLKAGRPGTRSCSVLYSMRRARSAPLRC